MRRFGAGVTVGFLVVWAVLASGQGTPAPGSFKIQDPVTGAFARLDHFGALYVTSPPSAFREWSQSIGHVETVLHVQVSGSGTPTSSLSVRCVNPAGTAFADCGGAGGGADAVNVFHQSTVAHVSSVTHVFGRAMLVSQAGTYATFTATSLDVNVTTATLAVTQSGTWTAQPGNTPNTTAWLVNVGHVAAVLHIQVAGSGIPGASLSVRCVNTAGTAFADCGGTGGAADAVNVFHQSTVAHVSSVTHVAIAGGHYGTGQLSMHVSGVSNIGSGRENTGTTSMVCHSTLEIHVSGSTASGYPSVALIHLTSTNGGINQGTWRIYVCSLALWSNALSPIGGTGQVAGGVTAVARHFAAQFGIIEGSGTNCGTNPRAVIGSSNNAGSIPISAHTSVQMISPFPFLSTRVGGNDLCLIHGMRKTITYITGFITYRAAP